MRLEQINKPIKERGMPSSIIKHKQKLAMMTDKELADRFKDADEDKLRRMAWGHGYGKMSSHYWDRVQNARTTGGFREFDNPREIPVKPHTNLTTKEIGDRVEKAKEKLHKKPEPFDFSKLFSKDEPATEDAPFGSGMELLRMAIMKKFITVQEWDLLKHKWKAAADEVEQQYSDWPDGEGFGSSDHNFAIKDLMTAVGYEFDDQDTSGSFVVTKQPEEIEKAGIKNARMRDAVAHESEPSADAERADVAQGMWASSKEIQSKFKTWQDFMNSEEFDDYLGEGMIGKKMEYNDFLQNKLDTAIQEYDTPEKKAERDALMKQYLNKGGSVEKVPAGQTAYKGKELKPAFKKNPGTPQTSPMSDESANKKQNYSDKEIRQAKGIAFDKRYKGGNYTGASNTINKLKKGLSDHPDVADALRRANEDEPGYYKNPDKEFNINGMTTKQDVVQSIIDNIDNNELDTAKDSLNQLLDVVTGLHEEGDAYAPARLIGACEASLSHGLEMAQNVINKKYSMAEVQAEVIVQNWPILLDKMKKVYQTNERVEDGVIMCPEACCGKPVTECKCDAECEHCNCFIIKAQENKSESQDGLQPADLKRLGQTEPKIYVHKDGKTIMIPKSKHNEYLAKGWKQSALRAETSYESKLTDMLNQRLK